MPTKRNAPRPAEAHRAARQGALREQAVVLTFVLDLAADERMTVLDLARTLNAEPRDFARPDAVERAVRDLVGFGLLEIARGRVQPTRAARRFAEIAESGV